MEGRPLGTKPFATVTMQNNRHATAIRSLVEELEPREVPAVSVRFDYTYDTSGFFNPPERRAALERAAQSITPQLQDTLSEIAPSGSNTWNATIYNPVTRSGVTIPNPTIRQDELVVYIAAAAIGAGELGLTTSGGFSATGSRAWLDTIRARGQTGALATPKTDFATWGGMITFDDQSKWNFGTNNPAPNQYDFNSVAIHELLHVFGFGLGEPAFTRHITNGRFAGPNVVDLVGNSVAVVGDPPDHFAPGTSYKGQDSPMQPALAPGVKRGVTPLEFALLKDIGWNSTIPVSPPVVPAQEVVTPPSPVGAVIKSPATPTIARFAVGTANSAVEYGSNGAVIRTIQPYGTTYSGGVRTATADVTGDGVPDLLTATGPGQVAIVKLFDGVTGAEIATALPFESTFTGGVFIASADLNHDGKADLVVTPDENGGPVVAIYDGASLAAGRVVQLSRFYGINDPNFRGGIRPALGDVNRDGAADLVISAGYGGGPRIAILDGTTLTNSIGPQNLVADFFAFESDLRNGAFVTVADLNGDGFADVVAGAGPGGGPRVTMFDGQQLMANRHVSIANFFAGNTDTRTGVRVAAADVDGDGRPDLVTGGDSLTSIYNAVSLFQSIAPPAWLNLPATSLSSLSGLYVG